MSRATGHPTVTVQDLHLIPVVERFPSFIAGASPLTAPPGASYRMQFMHSWSLANNLNSFTG
ncbi:hypothetical protein J6590_058457 [Homalodisca vitripennis]|nr:hypothetical protein J6590_058457 [Homalodisca vitripennis]